MWFLQRQLPDLAQPQRGGQPSSLPTALVPQPSPRAPCGATLIHPETCVQHQPTGAAPKDYLNFPRNKNAALPIRAQKGPLTTSGLKKNGSQMAPSVTSF